MKWIVYFVSLYIIFNAAAHTAQKSTISSSNISNEFISNSSESQNSKSQELFLLESNDENVDELVQQKSTNLESNIQLDFLFFKSSSFKLRNAKKVSVLSSFCPTAPLFLVFSNIRC
jgi:hypothetical protein